MIPDQPFRNNPFPDEMDLARLHEEGKCDSTCDYCETPKASNLPEVTNPKAYQSVPELLRLITALDDAWALANSHNSHENDLQLAEALGRVNGQASICRIEMEVYGGVQ